MATAVAGNKLSQRVVTPTTASLAAPGVAPAASSVAPAGIAGPALPVPPSLGGAAGGAWDVGAGNKRQLTQAKANAAQPKAAAPTPKVTDTSITNRAVAQGSGIVFSTDTEQGNVWDWSREEVQMNSVNGPLDGDRESAIAEKISSLSQLGQGDEPDLEGDNGDDGGIGGFFGGGGGGGGGGMGGGGPGGEGWQDKFKAGGFLAVVVAAFAFAAVADTIRFGVKVLRRKGQGELDSDDDVVEYDLLDDEFTIGKRELSPAKFADIAAVAEMNASTSAPVASISQSLMKAAKTDLATKAGISPKEQARMEREAQLKAAKAAREKAAADAKAAKAAQKAAQQKKGKNDPMSIAERKAFGSEPFVCSCFPWTWRSNAKKRRAKEQFRKVSPIIQGEMKRRGRPDSQITEVLTDLAKLPADELVDVRFKHNVNGKTVNQATYSAGKLQKEEARTDARKEEKNAPKAAEAPKKAAPKAEAPKAPKAPKAEAPKAEAPKAPPMEKTTKV